MFNFLEKLLQKKFSAIDSCKNRVEVYKSFKKLIYEKSLTYLPHNIRHSFLKRFCTLKKPFIFWIRLEYPFENEHYFFQNLFQCIFFASVSGLMFHLCIWQSNCVIGFSQLNDHTENKIIFKTITSAQKWIRRPIIQRTCLQMNNINVTQQPFTVRSKNNKANCVQIFHLQCWLDDFFSITHFLEKFDESVEVRRPNYLR